MSSDNKNIGNFKNDENQLNVRIFQKFCLFFRFQNVAIRFQTLFNEFHKNPYDIAILLINFAYFFQQIKE